MEIGRPQHYRWLFGIVVALILLNLADAVLTIVWFLTGAATEANPIMDRLLQIGPVTFVVGKLTLASVGSLILWKSRRHALAVIGIVLLFLVYYFLLLYHLKAMNLNLLRHILG